MPDEFIEKRSMPCAMHKQVEDMADNYYPWKEEMIKRCATITETMRQNCAKLKAITEDGVSNRGSCAEKHGRFKTVQDRIVGGIIVVSCVLAMVSTVGFSMADDTRETARAASAKATELQTAVKLIKKDVSTIEIHIDEINEFHQIQSADIREMRAEQRVFFNEILQKIR